MLPPGLHPWGGDGPELLCEVDLGPLGAQRFARQDRQFERQRRHGLTLPHAGHKSGNVFVDQRRMLAAPAGRVRLMGGDQLLHPRRVQNCLDAPPDPGGRFGLGLPDRL